jgi:acyl carrier protein
MNASAVAGMISEILDMDELSEDENFFAVGGNSLLALTLVCEMSSRCGVTISLFDFFRDPTARGLSRLIGERRPGSTAAGKGGNGA